MTGRGLLLFPSLILVIAASDMPLAAPCVRPSKAGTVVQGDVAICRGRYRIPDPDGRGVIIAGSSGTVVDLTGVTLVSGDTVPSEYRGIGVYAHGVDGVGVIGGTIHGYQFGIRIDGGKDHRIRGTDVSGSRSQVLLSTPDRFDERDWLDIFHPDTFETYGAGVYLRDTDGAAVTGITATRAQNGIGLFNAVRSQIVDNDVSNNSGWGIHLWHSSRNTLLRNQAHHNVRCESETYRRGCDSAGILLREASDSNVVAENDVSFSGDGFFLSGQPGYVRPSIGNLVLRNDATGAFHNAFESTFSFGNTFIGNRADSSDYGFWLGYSTANVVSDNAIIGTRTAGIAIEHGQDNTIRDNIVVGGRTGIQLFIRDTTARESRGARVDGNYLARLDRGIVLQHTHQARLRDNILDGVGDALVADSASADAQVTGNVFLRAIRHFIVAPRLSAGGNYWAAASEAATRERIDGTVSVTPWRPARAAGY